MRIRENHEGWNQAFREIHQIQSGTITTNHLEFSYVSPDKNNARTISMQVGKPIETNSTFLDASYHRIYIWLAHKLIWKCWDFHISPPPHQLLELVISRILPVRANMENIHLGLVKVLKDSFVLPANHIMVRKHNEKLTKYINVKVECPNQPTHQVKNKTTQTPKQHPPGPYQGPQGPLCASCTPQHTKPIYLTNLEYE